ncbi:MAG: lipid-binding SYLF domain-containing protein, partial [Pseudomonadota bacterium]
ISAYAQNNAQNLDILAAQLKARALVTNTEATIISMLRSHPDREALQRELNNAAALLIVPDSVKAGFLVGAEQGDAVLVARADDGTWSYPAFYNVQSISVGFQFGAGSGQILIMLQNRATLASLFEGSVTVGGSLSGSVGQVGSGSNKATDHLLSGSIQSFVMGKGFYLGANVEGSRLKPNNRLTNIFYGDEQASARNVILEGAFASPDADHLRRLLNALTAS